GRTRIFVDQIKREEMNVRDGEEEEDASPDHQIRDHRLLELERIRSPAVVLDTVADHVAQVAEFVVEEEHRDPRDAERQPRKRGMLRVDEDDVVSLDPPKQQIAEAGRRSDQSSKDKYVAKPLDADDGRCQLRP